MNPLVSIITATYNSEKFIAQTIQAIQQQTYTNWELLITDDCSQDNTISIIKEYQKSDNRIFLFRLEKNAGAGIARNNSIQKAKGRFIAFCDSDDIWLSNKLEKQVDFMLTNNLPFTYGAYQKMNEKGEKGTIFYPPQEISYQDLLKTCSIGCLTAIYDTEKIGKMYMPSIRKRQDYGLWLLIFRKIKKTKGITNIPLAYYRVRAKSVSSNKIKAAIYHFKVLKQCGKVNTFKALYYFLHYAIRGFFKYIK